MRPTSALFFPYYPRYSFAVLYEGRPGEKVSGGRVAAPMVKKFFERIKDTIAPPQKALIVVDESAAPAAIVVPDDVNPDTVRSRWK